MAAVWENIYMAMCVCVLGGGGFWGVLHPSFSHRPRHDAELCTLRNEALSSEIIQNWVTREPPTQPPTASVFCTYLNFKNRSSCLRHHIELLHTRRHVTGGTKINHSSESTRRPTVVMGPILPTVWHVLTTH